MLIVFNKNEISVYSKGNVEKFSISEFSRNIRKVIQIWYKENLYYIEKEICLDLNDRSFKNQI